MFKTRTCTFDMWNHAFVSFNKKILAFLVVMNLMNILMFAKFLIDLLSGRTETKTELLFLTLFFFVFQKQ